MPHNPFHVRQTGNLNQTSTPLATTGTEAIRNQLRNANQLQRDPLSDQGTAAQINALSSQVASAGQSARTSAANLQASRGQAGFAGAFAQQARNIRADDLLTLTTGTSDIIGNTLESARDRAAQGASDLASAEATNRKLALDELELRQEIRQRERDRAADERRDRAQRILDQALLAEDIRQFNAEFGLDERALAEEGRQFDLDFGFRQAGLREDARQFDAGLAQDESQFGRGLREDARQFDVTSRLQRDELSQEDRQFFASLGLDRDRLRSDEAQFQANLRFDRDRETTRARESERDFGLTRRETEADISLANRQQSLAERTQLFDERFETDRARVADEFARLDLREQRRQFDAELALADRAQTADEQQQSLTDLLGFLESGVLDLSQQQSATNKIFKLLGLGSAFSGPVSSSNRRTGF